MSNYFIKNVKILKNRQTFGVIYGMIKITDQNKSHLLYIKNVIYAIKNEIDGKYYVGQSRQALKDRYAVEKWWKPIKNPYLKNAINKYGFKNFNIYILESDVKDWKDLNLLEAKYAENLNAYVPIGYNFAPCGKNVPRCLTTEYRKRAGEKNEKTYEFKDIKTNKIIKIKNLSKFCRDNNLCVQHFNVMLKRKIGSTYKGFCHKDASSSDILDKNLLSRNTDLKPPFILWKNNEKYIFDSITTFCNNNKLVKGKIVELLINKRNHYQGFSTTEILTKKEYPKNRKSRTAKYREIKLIDKDSNIITINNIKEFIIKNNLLGGPLYSVIRGTQKSAYGYTLHSCVLNTL